MSEQRVPNIIKLRAERVLQRKIDSAYTTDQSGVLKCVIGDSVRYVNIVTKEEVTATMLKAKVDDKQEKEENFTAQITRDKVIPQKSITEKAIKSTSAKNTVTKKKK